MESDNSDLTLVTTKLVIPPTYQQNIIPRPRLYQQLDRGIQGPLTLITAPTGSGKTTLVGAWSRQREFPVAWVSLESEDNDPSRFWRYIIAALGKLDPTVSQDTIRQSRMLPDENTLATLINQLTQLSHDILLILDDYHTITTPAIHTILQFLLNHLPPQLRICISTRAEPPLNLARLRAQGKVTDLQAATLNFTAEEVEYFLKQTMETRGLLLNAHDIAEIYQRTEGWVAGLQLLVQGIQERGKNDPATIGQMIRAFSGSQQEVLHYLTEEVLERQPTAIQEFLLETAMLEHLHADLCDAVTGQQNGQVMLRSLLAANLFLYPLDEQGQWYRYSLLFAELLRYRLQSIRPTFIPTLHQRACAWYEQQGLIGQAIEHAQAAGNTELATHLRQKLMSDSTQGENLLALLSEREQAVLRLMSEGKSNQEIAHALVVTVSTVKTHLNNIYAKLQVHTRLQAVARVYDLLQSSPSSTKK
jgi:LuxR family maltose regulon positive regulatory protein